MKIKLKPLKGLIRPVRRFGALGSAPTKRVENTVLSALCLQNAPKTPYCRLCVYTTLRKHRTVGSVPTIRLGCTVRNHNSKSLFWSTDVPHSTEHGYARVDYIHTYIYIYIYIYINIYYIYIYIYVYILRIP